MVRTLKEARKSRNKTFQTKHAQGSKSNAATNPNRQTSANTDGKNNSFRTKATIKRLNMYN